MAQLMYKNISQLFKAIGFEHALGQQKSRPYKTEKSRVFNLIAHNHGQDCLDAHLHLAIFEQIENLRVGNRPLAFDRPPETNASSTNIAAYDHGPEKPERG